MDIDEALTRLGKFNRWRIATYCMICASVTVSGCWHMMAIVFIGNIHNTRFTSSSVFLVPRLLLNEVELICPDTISIADLEESCRTRIRVRQINFS